MNKAHLLIKKSALEEAFARREISYIEYKIERIYLAAQLQEKRPKT